MTHAGGIACDCAECFVASTLASATGPVAAVMREQVREDRPLSVLRALLAAFPELDASFATAEQQRVLREARELVGL